jgi:hypothetical protein
MYGHALWWGWVNESVAAMSLPRGLDKVISRAVPLSCKVEKNKAKGLLLARTQGPAQGVETTATN